MEIKENPVFESSESISPGSFNGTRHLVMCNKKEAQQQMSVVVGVYSFIHLSIHLSIHSLNKHHSQLHASYCSRSQGFRDKLNIVPILKELPGGREGCVCMNKVIHLRGSECIEDNRDGRWAGKSSGRK